jgi:hypothetical protein
MNHQNTKRTMEELIEEMECFMQLVEQERKDFHDRCDENTCHDCIGL